MDLVKIRKKARARKEGEAKPEETTARDSSAVDSEATAVAAKTAEGSGAERAEVKSGAPEDAVAPTEEKSEKSSETKSKSDKKKAKRKKKAEEAERKEAKKKESKSGGKSDKSKAKQKEKAERKEKEAAEKSAAEQSVPVVPEPVVEADQICLPPIPDSVDKTTISPVKNSQELETFGDPDGDAEAEKESAGGVKPVEVAEEDEREVLNQLSELAEQNRREEAAVEAFEMFLDDEIVAPEMKKAADKTMTNEEADDLLSKGLTVDSLEFLKLANEELTHKIEEEESADEDAEDQIELLCFMLGAEEHAIRLTDVREVIKLRPITEVPNASPYVPGIISLRGQIIPVYDLRSRLGLNAKPFDLSSRIIVVFNEGERIGLIVDMITEVARINEKKIEPPPAVIGGVEAAFLSGVGRFQNRMLIILNLWQVIRGGVEGEREMQR